MQDYTQAAESIFRYALQAVEPANLIQNVVTVKGSTLYCAGTSIELAQLTAIYVVGAGKAAAPMAMAMEELLGDQISKGAIITKYNHAVPLQHIQIIEAGHPVPDENGLSGTETILSILSNTKDTDLVIVLLSGGGSALLVDIPLGCTLSEIQQCFTLLLQSGADIEEMNTVRKHLSGVKGGQLARTAYPAKVISLILSDVIGDSLDVIASGPTVADPTTFADSWDILLKYQILDKIPESILHHLQSGKAGRVAETPKPGDLIFNWVSNNIIGNNLLALQLAKAKAEELGYSTEIYKDYLKGEAREIATLFIKYAKAIQADDRIPKPYCILAGGETIVSVHGKGTGGRNQELALAAAIALENQPGIVLLAAGTDGTDGPTEVSGAVVGAQTLFQAHVLGLDAYDYLSKNDSYHFFQHVGGHIITGPTHTNVMDLVIVLIHA